MAKDEIVYQLPPKAHLLSDLHKIEKHVDGGVHKVEEYSIGAKKTENSNVQTGFLKAVNQGDYDAERAKYVIVTSILHRIFLDKSAAEERLVYEKITINGKVAYKLYGTLSYAVPNFKPMAAEGTPLPLDEKERDEVSPSVARLLRAPEIPLILLLTSLYGDDDLHPGNLGHGKDENCPADSEGYFVRIDYDRYWWLGSARDIVGKLLGYAREKIALIKRFFDNFPNNTGCFYMPPNSLQGVQGNFLRDRKYSSYKNFAALAGEPEFHRQMMTGALKILLLQPPSVIRNQIEVYLGKNDPFINKILPEIEQIRTELQSCVDDYDEGCINDQKRRVPSFLEFLQKSPSALRDVRKRAEEYNQQIMKEYGETEAQKFLIDIKNLEQEYCKIWRDCHKSRMMKLIGALKLANENIKNTSVTNDSKSPGNALSRAHTLLTVFIRELETLISSHLSKEIEELIATNKAFVADLDSLIQTYKPTEQTYSTIQPEKISTLLGESTSEQTLFNKIIQELTTPETSLNLLYHLERVNDQTTENIPFDKIPEFYERPKHTDPVVVRDCIRTLFTWVNNYTSKDFKDIIGKIISNEYANNSWWQSRRYQVEKYLECTRENNSNILARILSWGEKDDSKKTLNGCIVKKLLTSMLDDLWKVDCNYNIITARTAMKNNKDFVWQEYTRNAILFSKEDASLCHRYHKDFDKTIDIFYTAIADWALEFQPNGFKNVIDKILQNYQKKLKKKNTITWFRSGSSYNKQKHIFDGMLHNNKGNINILLHMLSGFPDNSNLGKTTFNYLWVAITDLAKENRNKETGNKTEPLAQISDLDKPYFEMMLKDHFQEFNLYMNNRQNAALRSTELKPGDCAGFSLAL